jgi:hypothetical protein
MTSKNCPLLTVLETAQFAALYGEFEKELENE